VADGRIVWNGGQTVWNKSQTVFGASSGQGQVSITFAGNQLFVTNKSGSSSRATFTDASTIVLDDWGGLIGTRSGGKIFWANGTVWDSFDYNALDAVFADLRTFPFPVSV